ncbi:MAG: hypothetical protein ABFD96_19565 [Armatimonadia bacterium]
MSTPPPSPAPFDDLITQARAEGHTDLADRLDDLLHHTAWTTGTELLGELGLAIRTFQRTRPRLSPGLRQLVRDCLRSTRRR